MKLIVKENSSLLGYLINVVVIALLFIVAFNKKGNKFILNLAIKIGAKLKIIKDKDVFLNRTNEIIADFHQNAIILMLMIIIILVK